MKSYSDSQREEVERRRQPHPIWRGIGFLMIVLIPVVSFVFSDVMVQFAKKRGVAIPEQLARISLNIPMYGKVNDLLAVLILTFVVALVLFSIFTIINAAAYRASADKTTQVFESKPQYFKRKRKLEKRRYK